MAEHEKSRSNKQQASPKHPKSPRSPRFCRPAMNTQVFKTNPKVNPVLPPGWSSGSGPRHPEQDRPSVIHSDPFEGPSGLESPSVPNTQKQASAPRERPSMRINEYARVQRAGNGFDKFYFRNEEARRKEEKAKLQAGCASPEIDMTDRSYSESSSDEED